MTAFYETETFSEKHIKYNEVALLMCLYLYFCFKHTYIQFGITANGFVF